MNDQFGERFFRKDLNLSSRWWHRLFFVILITIFIVYGLALFIDNEWTRYSKVETLSDRLDEQVRLISSLVQPEEKIAVYEHNLYGDYYGVSGGWLLSQEYYCTKNISNKVAEISAKTGINHYKGNLDLVSFDDFVNYLSQNNATCVQVLDLDNPHKYGDVKKALSYGLEANNMAIWEPSITKSLLNALLTIVWVILAFAVIVIIYYKVFVYVIFGKKNG